MPTGCGFLAQKVATGMVMAARAEIVRAGAAEAAGENLPTKSSPHELTIAGFQTPISTDI
jgi:hypothetical protein